MIKETIACAATSALIVGTALTALTAQASNTHILAIGDAVVHRIAAKHSGEFRTFKDVIEEARADMKQGTSVTLIHTRAKAITIEHIDIGGVEGEALNVRPVQDGDIVFLDSHSSKWGVQPSNHLVLETLVTSKLSDAVRAKVWQHVSTLIATATNPRDVVDYRLLFVKHHKQISYRVQHVFDLGLMGKRARTALPHLIETLKTGGRVSAETIDALGRIGPAAAEARDALSAIAKAGDARMAKRATLAMQAIGDGPIPNWPFDRRQCTWSARRMREMAACKFADEVNLRWHFQTLSFFRKRHKRWPKGVGVEFILGPWMKGIVPHTPQNRDRYFSAFFAGGNRHLAQLAKRDALEIWGDRKKLTAADSGYFAVNGPVKRAGGKNPLLCSPMYPDGDVVVLYSDASTAVISISEDDRGTWTPMTLGLSK